MRSFLVIFCYMLCTDDAVVLCGYKYHCSTAQLRHFYSIRPPGGNKPLKTDTQESVSVQIIPSALKILTFYDNHFSYITLWFCLA